MPSPTNHHSCKVVRITVMFDSIIPFDVVVCSVFLPRICSYCPLDPPYSTPYLSFLHSLKVPCDCSDIVYIRVSLQNNSFSLTLPLCNISQFCLGCCSLLASKFLQSSRHLRRGF